MTAVTRERRRPGLVHALLVTSVVALAACRAAYPFPTYEGGLASPIPAPGDVDAVVFLVGDAGATYEGRSPLMERLRSDIEYWSRTLARDSAVSVAFLGDIVYPYGVRDRGHPGFPQDSAHLWNQIELVAGEAALRHATVGLFIAGNHDWGNAVGDAAFRRVTNLQDELAIARASGPLVALLPRAGEPGPVIRDMRENVRLIFFDSQWFLREPSESARTAFLRDLTEALETAGDREVVLLAHHPFATAGPHGVIASGPTAVGALYLLAKSGALVQDLNSPAYGSLRARMRLAIEKTGEVPLVYAAGHDHSLQVLDGRQAGDPRNILVSGSASKLTSLSDTLGMRYGAVRPGYMMLVFRRDDAVDLFVTAGDPDYLLCPPDPEEVRLACMREGVRSFQVTYSETLPTESPADTAVDPVDAEGGGEPDLEDVEPPPQAVPDSVLALDPDSVVAAPGRTYPAGPIRRALLGNLNRDLWDIEFSVPVLDLDSVGGGLTPVDLAGGAQTTGLRLQGEDGLVYQFRPVVKQGSASMPDVLRSGAAENQAEDQMAALFPLGASMVAELLDAADVLVARPRLVIMPDDARLGAFRETFAGSMGWIEQRPDERAGNTPGFAGSRRIESSDGMVKELRNDPASRVNARAFLRARLVDMYVNDWDRHADNWRWAAFPEDGRVRWDPVPRDRDWAFARVDGLLPRVAGAIYPRYVSFGDRYPDVARLMWSGSVIDRRLLGGVERDVFMEEAARLQAAFSDSVIDRAIRTLPPEYLAVAEDGLRRALQARREELPRLTDEYYRLLAGTVDVYGSGAPDSVHLSIDPYSVTMSLWRGAERMAGPVRTYHRGETGELRLHLIGGDDVVTVAGIARLPMTVRIIGEPASVRLAQAAREPLLLEDEGAIAGVDGLSFHETMVKAASRDTTTTAGKAAVAQLEEELPGAPVMAWETRDWGAQWLVSPAIDYASEFGLHLGAKVTRLGFGFRQVPHQSRLDVKLLASAHPIRLVGAAEFEQQLDLDGLATRFEFQGYTQRHSRFYGRGNTTRDVEDESYYTTFRPHVAFDGSLLYRSPGETWSAWAGPRILHWGDPDPAGDRVIFDDSTGVYGTESFSALGLQAGIDIDARDDVDYPHDGTLARIEARGFPALADIRAPYAGVIGTLRTFWDLPGPLDPVLHVQVMGERVWGDAPYPELASVGGRGTLPGYRTGRFVGNSAASAAALLRAALVRTGRAGGLTFGTFGIAATGRVWLDDVPEPRTLHEGFGGGLFMRSEALDRTVSIAWVRGDRDTRTYLGLGFPF